MKKRILSILTIFGIGLSFCSADLSPISANIISLGYGESFSGLNGCFIAPTNNCARSFQIYDSSFNLIFSADSSIYSTTLVCGIIDSYSLYNNNNSATACAFRFFSGVSLGSSSSSCPDMLIDVKYNSGNTSTITCDGINYITIDGLSTLTNSTVNYEYEPYFNINYKDEDNQLLTESYSKNILYLENGQFKKTYTGNNDWILTVQGGYPSNSFSGYLPTFDVTGGIEEVTDSGNVFNNFAENSIKVLYSNIPSYIQYVIIIMILLFIIGIIRKFRKR